MEIGNDWLVRRVAFDEGRVRTESLARKSGTEYLDRTGAEFKLELMNGGERRTLTSESFRVLSHSWNDARDTLEVRLRADFDGGQIAASIFYQAPTGENFVRKWLRVHPGGPAGWKITQVTVEDLRLEEAVRGVVPYPRYPNVYPNGEDKVHSEPDKVRTNQPLNRFSIGGKSRAVVCRGDEDEGLFFFVEGLLGQEDFDQEAGLTMRQKVYADLSEEFVSGAAVIGAYSGPPEIGFKRYTEYLLRHYCAVRDKCLPVSWSTWLVTLEGNKPLYANFDRDFLLEYLELIRQAGFYDILHLDLGWEAGWPLAVDKAKFPNAMEEIVSRAREYGLEMTYWVNPFSAGYWKSDIEEQHPEWLVPDKFSNKSGAHPICILTDFYRYVEKRFVELVTDLGARVIYWDGLDWNIPECSSTKHQHHNQHELEAVATQRLADLCRKVHEARPDSLFVVFSLPFDNHRLCVVDQEQISDTYSYPTIKSELIQRQQLYQMTWEHPYKAIWGSWYGVNWHNAGEDNLKRPMRELVHAEMSMIGNGIAQAGGGFDLKQARPEFIEFLRKLFAFRKRFSDYFDTYQHLLGFPDGEQVDGEGHIINGKGFIVLVNPTERDQTVNLPLAEPELELEPNRDYSLTDWSGLEEGQPIGKARRDDEFAVTLGPLEVKYIGLDI